MGRLDSLFSESDGGAISFASPFCTDRNDNVVSPSRAGVQPSRGFFRQPAVDSVALCTNQYPSGLLCLTDVRTPNASPAFAICSGLIPWPSDTDLWNMPLQDLLHLDSLWVHNSTWLKLCDQRAKSRLAKHAHVLQFWQSEFYPKVNFDDCEDYHDAVTAVRLN